MKKTITIIISLVTLVVAIKLGETLQAKPETVPGLKKENVYNTLWVSDESREESLINNYIHCSRCGLGVFIKRTGEEVKRCTSCNIDLLPSGDVYE